MSNGWNSQPNNSPDPDSEQTNQVRKKKGWSFSAKPFTKLAASLLKTIQMTLLFVPNSLVALVRLMSRLSKRLKKGTAIAALVMATVLGGNLLAGNFVSAQTVPPIVDPATLNPSLLVSLANRTAVPIPEPANIGEFIKNDQAAIKLGKALFWDMQVGSDGIMSCATCHFKAGIDTRSKNQVSPGLLTVNLPDKSPNPDETFTLGGAPNYQLKQGDFPFHKLANPNDRTSAVISDTNDIASSAGVFNTTFVDVVPGSAEDQVTNPPDTDGFRVGNVNVRRVEPRNTPTVINTIFNFRNFWDGRAGNEFNGVSPNGLRDPEAILYQAVNVGTPTKNIVPLDPIILKNASLAGLAVAPPLSAFEMSASGRTLIEIGDKFGPTDRRVHSSGKGRKLGRKLGKKVLPLRPLAKQFVSAEDSVLGPNSRQSLSLRGLDFVSYTPMIQNAFRNKWWNSVGKLIRVSTTVNADGTKTNTTTIIDKDDSDTALVGTNEYRLIEYNFPLFFGLAVQKYLGTLVSDQTPFDKYVGSSSLDDPTKIDGDLNALTEQQKLGFNIFVQSACIACHAGTEFTSVSDRNVQRGRLNRTLANPTKPSSLQDTGFFAVGVRRDAEDIGLGASDGLSPVSRPLSDAVLAKTPGINNPTAYQDLYGVAPTVLPLTPPIDIAALPTNPEGVFKVPTLRNIELTAPYFHNGGMSTLEQVVDFYSRGGGDDSSAANGNRVRILNAQNNRFDVLNVQANKDALVAFLKSLTDERVRLEKAPFDHPQLRIPNGHPVDQTFVQDDGTVPAAGDSLKAQDSFLVIPAVGAGGRNVAPQNFLGLP
ncbi:cytochrome-c peroxidase [Nostoc sp.]|uniref:cytochrome-c peroxidase n=1 Tax=Nostoc sp. TaxID=1180 RepID=UPI0035945950